MSATPIFTVISKSDVGKTFISKHDVVDVSSAECLDDAIEMIAEQEGIDRDHVSIHGLFFSSIHNVAVRRPSGTFAFFRNMDDVRTRHVIIGDEGFPADRPDSRQIESEDEGELFGKLIVDSSDVTTVRRGDSAADMLAALSGGASVECMADFPAGSVSLDDEVLIVRDSHGVDYRTVVDRVLFCQLYEEV